MKVGMSKPTKNDEQGEKSEEGGKRMQERAYCLLRNGVLKLCKKSGGWNSRIEKRKRRR